MGKDPAGKSKLSSLQSKHDETLVELQRYKVLVENIQDYAIFLMDKDGYIQTWNKGAQKAKGYASDEIIGKHFSIFYLPKDKKIKKPQQELEIAAATGRVEDEGSRVRKDGTTFWANVVITALYDDNEELIGFAKITRNITVRKQQEDKLRKVNAELRQQQKELKRLSISKDEFISLASHQLRTPATAVKQLLGLMLEGIAGKVPPKQRDIIKKAYDSNERQLNVVNSLLSVAQVDSGKVVLRKSWVDVQDLIRGVIEEQADSIAAKKQSISLEHLIQPISIYADAQYLGMAIGNIIDNSSKYSRSNGKIKITVTKENKKVRITIADNGVGVDPGDAETLFEKFRRIPNELSQKAAGSGLGLYWVRKVVELHGGKVKVESKLGEGANFHLYIPIGGENA